MSEVFQPGFGTILKAGREEKQLTVADVAAKLKLTSRQVEALEGEDLSHLPSEVFVRGFVRNYARLLELDPDSLIAPVDVQAAVAETITAPSAGVAFSSGGLRRWVVLPLGVLLLFVLLVAVLYNWLRQGESNLATPEAISSTQETPAPAAPAPVQSQTLELSPQAAVMADGESAVSGTPAAPAAAAAVPPVPATPGAAAQPVAPAPVPEAAKPAPVPTPAPSAAAPAVVSEKPAPVKPAGAHVLRFEPAQDAWIQVVDGNGNRFSKLVRSGTAETFSGEPPFRLVVGEAARVRMSYDGHMIDLTPFIGQKVARLTLE